MSEATDPMLSPIHLSQVDAAELGASAGKSPDENREAVLASIDEALSHGGGTVTVPDGCYVMGPLLPLPDTVSLRGQFTVVGLLRPDDA